MRDLKQRLFDLLRSGGISVGDNNNNNNNSNPSGNNNNNNNGVPQMQILPHHQLQQQQQQHSPLHPMSKPKKLHEYTAADCNAAFLRKYHELSINRAKDRERELELDLEPNGASNVIYFNENLSMTSKYNVRQFPLTRYPSCPLSGFGMTPPRAEGSAGSSLAEDTESDRYNFCSDEDQSSNAHTLKLRCHKLHMDTDAEAGADADMDGDLDDEDHAESQLDSFCTLCTSTFSYNKCCRYCDNSLCGSKCNSERGSHASRLSCNRTNYGPIDAELDFNGQLLHQHPHHHQQRFGGSSKLFTAQQQPVAAAAAAIRYCPYYIYIA